MSQHWIKSRVISCVRLLTFRANSRTTSLFDSEMSGWVSVHPPISLPIVCNALPTKALVINNTQHKLSLLDIKVC